MPSDSRPDLILDPGSIDFPSDRITLGRIRKAEPDKFTVRGKLSEWLYNLEVMEVVTWEHEVADKAFAKALGLGDPHPGETMRELLSMLNQQYRKYGISSGLEQTKLLVREIESAAAALAQAQRGTDR